MQKSTKDFLEGIKSRDSRILRKIYQELFPALRKYIRIHGGSLEDAEDVFQDTIIVIFRKIATKDFTLSSSFSTFFYSVGKRIWLGRISKSSRFPRSDLTEVSEQVTESFSEEIERTERFKMFREKLELLGNNCREVLKLFFAGKSMKNIAASLGFKSEAYAKKRKYQCKQQLTDLIKKDPRFKEMQT